MSRDRSEQLMIAGYAIAALAILMAVALQAARPYCFAIGLAVGVLNFALVRLAWCPRCGKSMFRRYYKVYSPNSMLFRKLWLPEDRCSNCGAHL